LLNHATTKKICSKMLTIWQQNYKHICIPLGSFGLPFQPFIGIQAPAVAIEIGLLQKENWHTIIDPLVKIISQVIHET